MEKAKRFRDTNMYFRAWNEFLSAAKQKKKMNIYIENFKRRGVLRNNFQGWKHQSRLLVKQQLLEKAKQEVELART